MTRRRSPQKIENLLEDLESGTGNPETVGDWVEAYLARSLKRGWKIEHGEFNLTNLVGDGDVITGPDHSGEICIMETDHGGGLKFWIPEEDVPDWIGRDQLPVRG